MSADSNCGGYLVFRKLASSPLYIGGWLSLSDAGTHNHGEVKARNLFNT